jgi:tRNA A37 threonylcarbamoyladenosine dehydratase
MTVDRRFSGVDRLVGLQGACQIKSAHVVVVGIGGVGSWAVEALARSGVGRLTLIDMDHISESNINRQIHATRATLGQSKVLAMRDRVASYFPECEVTCVDSFVDTGNWPNLLESSFDAVIDACDQVRPKVSMAAWSRTSSCAFIAVGAAGGKRFSHLTQVDDLAAVTHDPLLAKIRYQLRKEFGAPRGAKKIGVASVFSSEAVAPPHASCGLSGDGSLNCHGFGSMVSVTATFGFAAAGYILNKLSDPVGIQSE